MKHLNYFLLISFSGMSLFSCTITKRHFGTGYHIEWRKKLKASEVETIAFGQTDSIQEESSKKNSLADIRPQIEIDSMEQASKTLSEKCERILKTHSHTNTKQREPIEKDQPDEPEPEITEEADQKVYPLTWYMMGIPPLIILSYILVMQSVYVLGGAGILILAFVGLVIGIISLVAVKRHPEKYKRTKLTRVFAMICIISCGIILYAGLLYFLTM